MARRHSCKYLKNYWILKFCTDKHTNFNSPFGKLTTLCGSSRIPTPELHKASCQLSIKGQGFFFNDTSCFDKTLGHQYYFHTIASCIIQKKAVTFPDFSLSKSWSLKRSQYVQSSTLHQAVAPQFVRWFDLTEKILEIRIFFLFLQWRKINSNALTLLASLSVAGTWNLLKTKTKTKNYKECLISNPFPLNLETYLAPAPICQT